MEKNKFMMIIIIVLLVVLLGVVAGFSVFVINGGLNPSAQEQVTREQPVKVLGFDDIVRVSLGEPITTNLAVGETGGKHVARLGVLIAYDNTQGKVSTAFAELLDRNMEYARSLVLACIYASTYEELSGPDGMATLERTIKERLLDEFETSLIVDVNISERVLQ